MTSPRSDTVDEPDHSAVVAPAPLIVAIARVVSPFKGGCPNTPPCEHPGYVHDIEDDDDPLPTCGADNEAGECPCGHAPAGFRRKPGQRVWQAGETVPADVWVMTLDGAGWTKGGDWINHFPGPLIEIEPIGLDGGPPAAGHRPAEQLDLPEDALPPGRYRLVFDHIGRHHNVAPLTDVDVASGLELAVRVYQYARPRLYSQHVQVHLDLERMTGAISVGPAERQVGTFTIEQTSQPAASAPASGQPEEAAGGQES
jgi:hypothetical protein